MLTARWGFGGKVTHFVALEMHFPSLSVLFEAQSLEKKIKIWLISDGS